jgi:hypothetical protein
VTLNVIPFVPFVEIWQTLQALSDLCKVNKIDGEKNVTDDCSMDIVSPIILSTVIFGLFGILDPA